MTSFEREIKTLEFAYTVYEFLHADNLLIIDDPMKSEGEFIRTVIAGWSRARAIKVYKHLYAKESGKELDSLLIRKARFSRNIEVGCGTAIDRSASMAQEEPSLVDGIDIDELTIAAVIAGIEIDGTSLYEILFGFDICEIKEASTHIFEFPCHANPVVRNNAIRPHS